MTINVGGAEQALIETQDKRIESLQAQVAALEAGAKRYQHMRENAAFQDRNGPGVYWYLPRWNRELPVGERLDAAIDAAIDAALKENDET